MGSLRVAATALFALPFAGFGLFAAAHGFDAWTSGEKDGVLFILFGLAFVGIGVGIVALARRGRRRLAEIGEQLERNADRPWLINEDWASGVIEGSGRAGMWISWVFALVWCAFSIPLVSALPAEVDKGNQLALIGLLFPLSGLGMLAWAAVSTARYRRFGRTRLQMQTLPGVLGGELRASLNCQKPLPGEASVRVTLCNIRRTVSGSGKNRSVSESALWEDYVDVPASRMTLRPDGYGLDIRMQVPFDTRASDPLIGSDSILWRLSLHAELPGPDFSNQFDIPIFETPESDPSLTSGVLSRKRREGRSAMPSHARAGSSIDLHETPCGGIELYFPPARNKGAATIVTLTTVIFGSASWLMIGHTPLLFPIVFGFVSVLLLTGSVNMWLSSLRVVVESQGVTATKRLLGIPRTRRVSRGEIESISIDAGMRSGNTTYWDVRVRLTSDTWRSSGPRIGPTLRDRHEAEELCHRAEDILALS
jgi:hypothetical protein